MPLPEREFRSLAYRAGAWMPVGAGLFWLVCVIHSLYFAVFACVVELFFVARMYYLLATSGEMDAARFWKPGFHMILLAFGIWIALVFVGAALGIRS